MYELTEYAQGWIKQRQAAKPAKPASLTKKNRVIDLTKASQEELEFLWHPESVWVKKTKKTATSSKAEAAKPDPKADDSSTETS